MARFHELLEVLRNPGEGGAPETIYDDLALAYDDDVTTRDAKIGEYEAGAAAHAEELQGRDSEISRLKAVNYDLMMASQTTAGGDSEGEGGDGDGDSDDGEGGVDGLFGRDD